MRNEAPARFDYLDPTNDVRVKRLQTRQDVMVLRCVYIRDVVKQASHPRQHFFHARFLFSFPSLLCLISV